MRKTGGIYTFQCDNKGPCDQLNFEKFTFDEDVRRITCPTCGGPVHRETHSTSGGESPDQFSEAAGVHPSQIAECKAMFPHHDFTPDGRMIFHGQRHKDRCLKDIGFVEHDRK